MPLTSDHPGTVLYYSVHCTHYTVQCTMVCGRLRHTSVVYVIALWVHWPKCCWLDASPRDRRQRCVLCWHLIARTLIYHARLIAGCRWRGARSLSS